MGGLICPMCKVYQVSSDGVRLVEEAAVAVACSSVARETQLQHGNITRKHKNLSVDS